MAATPKTAAEVLADVWTPAMVRVVLNNVRRELHAVHRATAERRQGRFSPPTDGKVALEGVERLAVAVEALAEIVERKLNV